MATVGATMVVNEHDVGVCVVHARVAGRDRRGGQAARVGGRAAGSAPGRGSVDDLGGAPGCGPAGGDTAAGVGNLAAGVPVDADAGFRRLDQRGGRRRRLDLPSVAVFILMFF